ncbi:hypothetical protein, partial [Akkermansia sp.]
MSSASSSWNDALSTISLRRIMKEIKSFSQGQLIRQTGNIYPSGICLGLVTYWLIACHRHEESQFWADIEHSIST